MRVAGVEDRPGIAVVGAGIGGLALAAALAASGTRCEVFEQASWTAEDGAGLELAPNAVRPLRRLGLGPVLRARAVRTEATELRGGPDGRAVARLPLGAACERLFGAPHYTVRRSDLRAALLECVAADQVHLSRSLSRLDEDDDGVTLHFADGSTHRAQVVVGADGVRSAVRESVAHDHQQPPRPRGLAAYQGLLPVERLPRAVAREAMVRIWLGPDARLECYPVAGGSQVSFTAVVTTAVGTVGEADDAEESWSAAPHEPGALVSRFGDWRGLPAQIACAAARAPGSVRRRLLYDREPLKPWATSRVTVLGDAAHPALALTSQGVSQTVEDAFDLAACLAGAGHRDTAAALARYESLRVPRVAAAEHAVCGVGEELPLPDDDDQHERDAALRERATLRARADVYAYDAGRQGFVDAG